MTETYHFEPHGISLLSQLSNFTFLFGIIWILIRSYDDWLNISDTSCQNKNLLIKS